MSDPSQAAGEEAVAGGPSRLLELSGSQILDRFAAPQPTPGGGSAAALVGALGAALVAMVSSLPRTRTGAPEERARLDGALEQAQEAGQRLRQLVEDDRQAFDAVMSAYRLPKSDETAQGRRKQAIGEALVRATQVPLETAELCRSVLASAIEAAAYCSSNALSDARTAAALALSGLLGAAENVRINANGAADVGARAVQRVDVLLREALARASAVGLLP